MSIDLKPSLLKIFWVSTSYLFTSKYIQVVVFKKLVTREGFTYFANFDEVHIHAFDLKLIHIF